MGQDELGAYDYGARFYDPVIGRWNAPDMLAELAPGLSPFRYCYNNPVNYTDPFGLFESRKEARKYRRENKISGQIKQNDDGSYSIHDKEHAKDYSTGDDSMPEPDSHPNDGVVESALVIGQRSEYGDNQGESFLSEIWNSPLARYLVPDIMNLNFNMSIVPGLGIGHNFSINLLTRGKDVGFYVLETGGGRIGLHGDISINFSGGYFLDNPRTATLNSYLGDGIDISGDFVGGLGVWGSRNGTKLTWAGYNVGLGASAGASIGFTETTRITKKK